MPQSEKRAPRAIIAAFRWLSGSSGRTHDPAFETEAPMSRRPPHDGAARHASVFGFLLRCAITSNTRIHGDQHEQLPFLYTASGARPRDVRRAGRRGPLLREVVSVLSQGVRRGRTPFDRPVDPDGRRGARAAAVAAGGARLRMGVRQGDLAGDGAGPAARFGRAGAAARALGRARARRHGLRQRRGGGCWRFPA